MRFGFIRTSSVAPGWQWLSYFVNFSHLGMNGIRDQVFPGLRLGNPAANFGGRHGFAGRIESNLTKRSQLSGLRPILASPACNQEIELAQHFFPRAGTAIVPLGYALGGIAATKKTET